MAPKNSGIGCILALHRVHRPAGDFEIGATRTSVSPDNLRRAIAMLLARDYEFVSMSGVAERIRAAGPARRKFVCLTFDDGFADTYSDAFPICRSFGVPMVVYLISGVVNRSVPMWWLGLDRVIAENSVVELFRDGGIRQVAAATPRQKRQAYFRLANWFVAAPARECREACDRLGDRYGIDFMQLTDRHALTADRIREMQASGLVEFGAHTVSHPNLRRLDADAARGEIVASVSAIEGITGQKVRHFAYPYGGPHEAGAREFAMCREAGMETAVTTRMATVFPGDRANPHALPRLTLNGDYQDGPLLELLISGTLPKIRQIMNRSGVAEDTRAAA
jgi:peptidoglycan/xylan/chitin deacetylase (PgdA/CDA1 family)